MSPEQKKPSSAPRPTKPVDDDDFADEAAPKSSEFETEKEAKDITGREFEPIP